MTPCSKPVSYTHLDVYKRQVLNRRFIDLIIVVDDLPFGIADFLTADVAVFFQFQNLSLIHI